MDERPLVTIFGSHHPAPGSAEYREAEELGRELATAGFRVATGGYGGTMEAALKGAGGGIGYTVEIFSSPPNGYVTKEIRTGDLFARISRILAESDALVVLKGGTGTLLELAAAWEMVNKKMIPFKPIVCLGSFWRQVVATLDSEPSINNISDKKPQSHSAASYVHFADSPAQAAELLREKIPA